MIIGICGRKYSGKDSTADYLVKKYNYTKIAFADPIKTICETLFKFSSEQLNTSLKEVPDENWNNLKPRQVMQFVGTDLFRDHMRELDPYFEDKFWILCAKRKIDIALGLDPNSRIVISDVRFPNEAEFVRSYKGCIVRITRPPALAIDTHISESLISTIDVDHDILNDGTIDELHTKIDRIGF